MKKSIFTLVLLVGLLATASAQNRGLFDRGPETGMDYYSEYRGDGGLILPDSHGGNGDVDAPLGTGTALLLGLGAAYLVSKKRREE